jgi:hypothetical protein
LPGVQNIDFQSENFDSNTRLTIQEIYNNIANRVSLSEIYIAPLEFNPERIDFLTDQYKNPIIMFDDFIRDKTKPSNHNDKQDYKIEIYEYQTIAEQLRC